MVWNVVDPIGKAVLYSLFGFGWGLVLVATFLINPFDLFGLRQVWLYLVGRAHRPLKFGAPGLYKWVRHPLYEGWFFAFLSPPTMTASHLVLALLTTGYILIVIQLEERDLRNVDPEYAGYRKRVPMLIPRFKRGGNAGTPAAEAA